MILLFLFSILVFPIYGEEPQLDKGQEAPEKKASEYRREVLSLIRKEKFEEAEKLLKEALALYPEDQDLLGLQKSLEDLNHLNNPVFSENPPPVKEEPSYDKMKKPDFVITARDPDKVNSGEKSRNTVALDTAFVSTIPMADLKKPLKFLNTANTALGASGDIRYYFPLFKSQIGLGLWYEGYFGDLNGLSFSSLFFNQGGLNLLLRNFPVEDNDIRTEISLELGGGLSFFKDPSQDKDEIYYSLLLQVALYAEDPLLFRLLSYNQLKNLYFKGGIRFFYFFDQNTNMVRYRLGMALRPGKNKTRWEAGIYFHLEDMDISDWNLSSWGIIFGLGFRF